jgi:DNA-binding helix-hairpin-helix protein with protein kinase domain
MSFYGEHEDIVNPMRAEIGSLREELQRLRLDNEAKDREIEVLDKAAREVSRQNFLMRQQLQSWADEADGEIQLAKIRRSELEALEL